MSELLYNDNWFHRSLKEQTVLKTASQVFKRIHGPEKRPEISIEVLKQNLNENHIKKCTESLISLDKIVPSDFAQVVRYCAVTYANFCDEIFAGLEEFYFQSVSLEWLLHSESSYSSQGRYRDHLTHQMKVTLLGLELLNGSERNEGMLKEVTKSLKDSKQLSRFLTANEIQDNFINDDVTIASWLLAGLFHDIGYCFLMNVKTSQKLSGVSNFFSSTPAIEMWKNVEPLITESSYLAQFMKASHIDLNEKSSLADIKETIRQLAFEGKNHSVIGGLYLIYMVNELKRKAKTDLSDLDPNLRKKLSLIFEIAAVAVLTHDLDSPSKQVVIDPKTGEKKNVFHKNFSIPFNEYPISYLLGVCDQIQEWGRIRVKRKPIPNQKEVAEIHLIDADSVTLNKKNDCLTITIDCTVCEPDFLPSFPILGKAVKLNSVDGSNFEQSLTGILSHFPNGRLTILNAVYGSCPHWKKFDVKVKAGGVIYSVSDFFKDNTTKITLQRSS